MICIIGQERGYKCLPVIPGTPWCAKHHPDRAAERSRQSREAALARVPEPPPVNDEIEKWLVSIDYDSPDACRKVLREVSQLVGLGKIFPQRAREIRLAAADALKSFPGTEKKTKAQESFTIESWPSSNSPTTPSSEPPSS